MSLRHPAVIESDASVGVPDGRSLPRLLTEVPSREPMSLDRHIAVHGELPHERRQRRRHESVLIERIERAGLRGRGGAGFPTAVKLRAVAPGRRPIVVINADEGEPASLKDRTLSELLPHLMLDGGELAAEAVGAEEVIVCVCESAIASVQSVSAAIEERRGMRGSSVRMRLSVVPAGYVAGHESALVNHLNGGPAIPTFTPPMPYQQGVRHRATLINNAETLAQLALIARYGATWFRELGTASQPGSALVTLSGPVAHPGVYEIEHGSSLTSLVDAAGGTTVPARAALLGGYAGAWIDGSLLAGLRLSDEHLATHGASLGAGVVLLLSKNACPVAETARVARWLADQSARQCGPCLNGLDALATTVEEIAGGAVQGDGAKRVERLAALVHRRGACRHPDGTARLILGAFDTFAAEFADHARHGACADCDASPELPLPTPTRREPRRHEPVTL